MHLDLSMLSRAYTTVDWQHPGCSQPGSQCILRKTSLDTLAIHRPEAVVYLIFAERPKLL
jgi:hypothetical protein